MLSHYYTAVRLVVVFFSPSSIDVKRKSLTLDLLRHERSIKIRTACEEWSTRVVLYNVSADEVPEHMGNGSQC